MKKIIVASLLLSTVSYGASGCLRQRSIELANASVGVPHPELIAIPEIDANVAQREVMDLEEIPNSDFRVSKTRPGTLEPVDPKRREAAEDALVYNSASLFIRQGIWLFPLLGIALVVWQKLEEIRIRRLMETIENESKTTVKEQP